MWIEGPNVHENVLQNIYISMDKWMDVGCFPHSLPLCFSSYVPTFKLVPVCVMNLACICIVELWSSAIAMFGASTLQVNKDNCIDFASQCLHLGPTLL